MDRPYCRSGVPRIATGLVRVPFLAVFAASLTVGAATAGPTATSLSAPSGKSVYGQTVTFTAGVAGGGPSGTVTFLDKTTALARAPVGALVSQSSLAVGGSHTCALSGVGGAWCWGQNLYYQLGNGTADSDVPIPVTNLSSGVRSIAAGGSHTCALTAAGGVQCWGYNAAGQLGVGTPGGNYASPVPVSGLSSGVVAVVAGSFHTCALTGAGAVLCWGYNNKGQIGDGTTTSSSVPVPVSGLSSGVVSIAAGYGHTCAVRNSGAVLCWGANGYGQLGNGKTVDSLVPVTVFGLSGATAVSAAPGSDNAHTCALTGAGAVVCWGRNNYGQLGNGTMTDSSIPVSVSSLSTGVAAISVGDVHACAATTSGAAKCWGRNTGGQLGDGSTADSQVPVSVANLSSGVVAIAAGSSHSCALTDTGAARCWGYNSYGKLGDGTSISRSSPVPVSGFGAGTARVFGEATFATAALSAGAHTIAARYNGDSLNASSTSAGLRHVVEKGKTKVRTIAVKPRRPAAGTSARLTVRMKAVAPARGAPVGKAVVKDGRKRLGKIKVRKGKASLRLRALAAGKHRIKVLFQRNRTWKGSRGVRTVRVR